jgi:hypothetical protein
MPEETQPPAIPPVTTTPVSQPPERSATGEAGASFNIGEEFGTAKRNLPPAKVVAIAIGIVAVVLGFFAFLQRATPQGSGSVDNIAAADVAGQNAVLVAVNVTLRNSGAKTLYVHTIKGTLKTDSGEVSDDAASAVDFDRYFQAFPVLKEHAIAALTPETKIPSAGETRGTVMFYFPVTQDVFNKRKSLSVVIQPYDQPVPVVLSK